MAHAVLAAGLVDEIRLLIFPAVQGRGKGLVTEGTSIPHLELLESQAFRGERAEGTWSVSLTDVTARGGAIVVSDVKVSVVGATTRDDRYVFTDAYSKYAGVAGHARAVSDTNGGQDTVNAAAYAQMRTFRSPIVSTHETTFFILLALIAIHVAAAVFAELREGGSVVSAMFTGRKILKRNPPDL